MKAYQYFSVLSLWVLLLPALGQAETDGHDHSPLVRSTGLSYTQVFQQAVIHAPEALAAESRQTQAIAHQQLAQSWTAGSPRALFNYIDDSSFDNSGMRELEAGLEWQLWAFGGRSASRKLGEAYGREATAWHDYLQLAVAGRLRTALADISQSEILLAQAESSRDGARQLLAIAERQFAAGAAPREAVMQAKALLLADEKNLLDAQAMLIDAERNYSVLTGLEQRPQADYSEAKSDIEDISLNHPMLRFLQASVDVAADQVQRIKQEARGNPTLALGMRRQRDDRFADYSDSLMVGVSIPFGGASYANAKTSDAQRNRADAEVQYQTAYRQLLQGLHETEHELATIDKALPLSKEQREISLQRSQMARTAFENGETTMTQVVQALQQSLQADTEYQLLQHKQQRLIAEFNQIVGVLP